MADMDENLLSSKEVLAYLKIHRQTLWRLEKSGAVQPVKIGTVKRYNGFTLLLMLVSLIGGIMLGVKIEMYYQLNQRDQWLNGETVEDQMRRDGWTL